jgi:hypothetical protein
MRGALYQISTFTAPTATLAEKAELSLQLEKAFPTTILVSVEATGFYKLLVKVKYCLNLIINLRAVPGRMLISLSS